jgi:hypothetical protein
VLKTNTVRAVKRLEPEGRSGDNQAPVGVTSSAIPERRLPPRSSRGTMLMLLNLLDPGLAALALWKALGR